MVRVPTRSLALALCECKNGHRRAPVPGRARPAEARTSDGARNALRPGPRRGPGLAALEEDSDADADGVGLRTLLTLDHLEEDPLALVEALVAVHLDRRVVDE